MFFLGKDRHHTADSNFKNKKLNCRYEWGRAQELGFLYLLIAIADWREK
jgi:hypothetical protein